MFNYLGRATKMFVLRGEERREQSWCSLQASAPDTAAREQQQQPAAWQAASSHFDWQLQYEEDMADIKMGLISSSLH